MANRKNGALYTGVTADANRRVFEHKNDVFEGFTKKYGIHKLVYYELHETMEEAILQEKRIKRWHRKWKIDLIEKANPDWKDLFSTLAAGDGSRVSQELARDDG